MSFAVCVVGAVVEDMKEATVCRFECAGVSLGMSSVYTSVYLAQKYQLRFSLLY